MNKPLRVLQINTVYGIGSTGSAVAEISDEIKRTGGEAFIAYAGTNAKVENGFYMGGSFSRKADALKSRVFGLQEYGNKSKTKRLLRWIDQIKPDVAHLHNLHSHYINLPMLLRYLAQKDIPTVVTLHDCWFFTGKCTHYAAANCEKWKSGCGGCPQLKKDVPSWFFDRSAKMWADKKRLLSAIPRLAVVGVSDWITNQAKESFLGSAKIVRRIYNWIDLDSFYPRREETFSKYGATGDKFTVICIGAGWKKGSSRLNDLLLLAEKLPSDMQIVLVGNAEDADTLPSNVISVGYVSGTDDLARLYSQADAYVHLSREDTFGKVIAEAMSCGIPAVVYNSTACPEIVGDGCGRVVETGNVDEICRALIEIKQKGKSAYSAACSASVSKRFEKRRLLEKTTTLYRELIRGEKE